ncbi:MAG: Dienelactone hydrolase [Acidimicrobiales bacterium]|nr:Dienelactone hydrolase [Acidimicrobiales bacterium]
MRLRSFALAGAALMTLVACEPQAQAAPQNPGAPVTEIQTTTVTIPGSFHAQGLALPAKVVRPKLSSTAPRHPGMMVLHGSGGLEKMPKTAADKPCSTEMEAQFVEWADRLAKQGYTVLLPSSYSARGFCDKHDDAARIPKSFDKEEEQVLGRIYDTDAATRYLCTLPDVDCDHVGVLGFSQGATMAMLAMHGQINHAISNFRQTKAALVDGPIPDLKAGRPAIRTGIAYYPGCGFNGLIPLSTSANAASENKYAATGPMTVLHGSLDPLVDHCSTAYGIGSRQTQSAQVASATKTTDHYQVSVYAGAHHSFANPGTTGADKVASDAALKVTMGKLATQL